MLAINVKKMEITCENLAKNVWTSPQTLLPRKSMFLKYQLQTGDNVSKLDRNVEMLKTDMQIFNIAIETKITHIRI